MRAAGGASADLRAAAESPPSGPFEVVASGLNNPRGLTFGPDGGLFVAESGLGGDGPCFTEEFEGETFRLCYGPTGSITKVADGKQQRVVTGLPSIAEPGGFFALGPHDVSFDRRGVGWVPVGLWASAEFRADFFQPEGRNLASLARFDPRGNVTYVADLAAYEAANNVDGYVFEFDGETFPDIDSNPYAVLAERGSRLVVDASGNDLLRIHDDGSIEPAAVFPTRTIEAPDFYGLPPGTMIEAQSVPTSVVKGPDGAYYVGELAELTGPGTARVCRVEPGRKPQVFARGFTRSPTSNSARTAASLCSRRPRTSRASIVA